MPSGAASTRRPESAGQRERLMRQSAAHHRPRRIEGAPLFPLGASQTVARGNVGLDGDPTLNARLALAVGPVPSVGVPRLNFAGLVFDDQSRAFTLRLCTCSSHSRRLRVEQLRRSLRAVLLDCPPAIWPWFDSNGGRCWLLLPGWHTNGHTQAAGSQSCKPDLPSCRAATKHSVRRCAAWPRTLTLPPVRRNRCPVLEVPIRFVDCLPFNS